MVDLRQVQAFVAVVQTGSFTKAADRLHIGQSGLSAQVKKLEQAVGGKLFERNARNVSVTPLGQELYVYAQDVLAAAERFSTAADMPGRKRMLRLAVAENGVNELALTLLRRIRQHRPDVDLEVRPMPLRDQHIAFDRDIEVLIARPPYDAALPQQCTSIEAAHDDVAFVVHESSDLAERTSLTTAEVLATPRVRTGWVPDAWSIEHPVFDVDGSDPSASAITSFREAAATVSVLRTACVMPASFARTYNIPDVVAIPVSDESRMRIDVVFQPSAAHDVVRSLPELLDAGMLDVELVGEALVPADRGSST